MSAITVRIPESLHKHLRKAAEIDGVSVNQFISLAVAEKISALQTYDLITRRSERGSREAFLEALASVPSISPIADDEIPEEYKKKSEDTR